MSDCVVGEWGYCFKHKFLLKFTTDHEYSVDRRMLECGSVNRVQVDSTVTPPGGQLYGMDRRSVLKVSIVLMELSTQNNIPAPEELLITEQVSLFRNLPMEQSL